MGWRLAGLKGAVCHGEVTKCRQERQVTLLTGLSLDPKGLTVVAN